MVRTLSSAIVLLAGLALAAEPGGIRPLGKDGKPLNLDFESGDLRDWTATGDAFKGQPIKGDVVSKRRGDMKSSHQGEYWIGGYERAGDKPMGTLESVPFTVAHPWATFLVGGGPHPTTAVEIIRADTKQLITRIAGIEEENLKPVAVDLTAHLGKQIFIRLVDRHPGHWGHLNFDDFRFHEQKPNVPQRQAPQPPPAPDVYKFAGLAPEKAAEVMTVPEGFTVKLFAGEPAVRQPVAFCLDDRGRVWVAEAHCYPRRRPEGQGQDRIIILEDTDGDGVFNTRKVFMEGLNLVSGLEVGHGGVWIGAAPYLMFVPLDATGDAPAGKPQILLDGWAYEDTHETLNTFMWGPDGWLYGCHGVFTHSNVGKPGAGPETRTRINAGVWRYHPIRHEFEVFAHGTSNPWGLDFNDVGEAFVEACVIPHCFHIIQGGRYLRQAGAHFNPYTYADIQTIADHRHYLGPNPHGGNNRSDSAGGGHAHCGLMCYLGGTWPADYRGRLFMGNVHGRRLNVDILKPNRSGYTAAHGPDFLLANDAWARFINLRYGPDGNVYLIDWYDQQACHRNEPEIWDRSNGRIYKISWRGTQASRPDLSAMSDMQLAELQLSANDWFVRHARRVLSERWQAKKSVGDTAEAQAKLREIMLTNKDETRRLRAMWALHGTGGLTPSETMKMLADSSPHVRGWAIRLAAEQALPDSEIMVRIAAMAKSDPSPVVRREIASAAQRHIAQPQVWLPVLQALVQHGEDAGDPNLPYLYWYALEPVAKTDAQTLLQTIRSSAIPVLEEFAIRRVASEGTREGLESAVRHMASARADRQAALIRATIEALKGRRKIEMPDSWPGFYERVARHGESECRRLAVALAVIFGDPRAYASLAEVLKDGKADLAARQDALATLLSVNAPSLPAILRGLLADRAMRGPAIRGLAAFSDPATPLAVLAQYSDLTASEKRDAVNLLASRVSYGRDLLKAIGDKRIPASDVPADVVRQLRNLRDAEIDQQIASVWGLVRSTSADRQKLMLEHRRQIIGSSRAPDLALGRALYAKTCQQCHVLFGVGGKVGPDITGANRGDLNYLLENVLDPSAVIPKEYLASRIDLKNGRVITGIVKEKNDQRVVVATATETLTLSRADIEEIVDTNVSMMPDDQLKPFTQDEVRALFAYLQSPTQVPLLATKETAKDFFNGKDLTGWDGDPKLWNVVDGEIVGKSPGIKKNEFLKSQMLVTDFRLTVKVKLTPNTENSGIQFRSEAIAGGDVKGPQADIGAGWWGKLYEEHGRGLLWDKPGDLHVKVGEWNEYQIEAQGSKIKTWINGKLCVDLDDPKISRRGIVAFQIHSGKALEVRFKDIKLEVLESK